MSVMNFQEKIDHQQLHQKLKSSLGAENYYQKSLLNSKYFLGMLPNYGWPCKTGT